MGNIPKQFSSCNCCESKEIKTPNKMTIQIEANYTKVSQSKVSSYLQKSSKLDNSTIVTKYNINTGATNTHIATQNSNLSPLTSSSNPKHNFLLKPSSKNETNSDINRRHSQTFNTVSKVSTIEKKIVHNTAREEGDNSINIESLLAKMKKAYKSLPRKETVENEGSSPPSRIESTTLIGDTILTKPIEQINTPFTDKQLRLIRNLLIKDELIVSQMDEATINLILNIITFIQTKENVTLYSFDNETDNILYIINRGKLCYEIDGKKNYLRKYESIGTKALKKNAKTSCKLFTVHRSQIFCLPIEKYKTIIQDFLDKDKEEKIELLKPHFFFNFLDTKSITALAKVAIKRRYEIRKEIISEGSMPDSFFLIVEGEVFCVKNDTIIHTLKCNDTFGEISMFSSKTASTPSPFTYIVDAESTLLEIPFEDFSSILGEKPLESLMFGIFTSAIKKCEYLNKHLTGDRLNIVFKCFKLNYNKEGEVSNFKKKKIFIPISGFLIKNCKDKNELNSKEEDKSPMHKNGQHIIQILPNNEYLPKGELFINSILSHKDDGVHIFSNESIVFQAYWEDILKKIGCLNSKKSPMIERINAIRSLSICKHLSELKIFLISDLAKIYKYKDGTVILKRGPSSSQLFIIRSGEVKISISNTTIEVKSLKEKMNFGDIKVSEENDKDTEVVKNFDFIAKGTVECLVIEKEDYEEIVDNSNNAMLTPLNKLFNNKQSIPLNSLYYSDELGYGTYGKVYLVHDGKKFYAMKTADIQVMCGNKVLAQYYLNEKSIMLSINHPFIVRLINTYKTSELIFFLMEYVEGISLRQYMERRESSLRNINEAIFYGATLFIVLNYLQKMRIIHRDLKPENLMIETNGYLKVIDFGIAKDLSGKDSTHTLIGTPHYMAPEIILGKRYSFAADYWSVGIVLYEIFYGKVPFGMNVTDSNKVFSEITEKKLAFPTDPKNNNFNMLIKNLLYKNPNKRTSSFAQIKANVFFQDVDFEEITEKKRKPIYIPLRKVSDKDLEQKGQSFYSTVLNNLFASSVGCDSVADRYARELSKENPNDYLSEF